MRRFIFLLVTIFLLTQRASSQSFVALSTGISTDLNNSKPFLMVPLTLRWEPFKRSAFFVEVIKPLVFSRNQNSDAYTTNPQLAEHEVLTETIKLHTYSFGIGGAFVVYTTKKDNVFSMNLSWGYCEEKFIVNYKNYDTKNYEVLNPDVSEDFEGLYAAASALYTFDKKKTFIMLRVQSSSSAKKGRYELSYIKTAPLQLTYGFNFNYNKK